MSEPIKVFPVRWGNPLCNIFDKMTRRISDNLFKDFTPDPRDLENEVSDEEKGRIEIESHTYR